MPRISVVIALFASALSSGVAADQSEPAQQAIKQDVRRPLMTTLDAKREKKLKRAAEKTLKRIRENGRYIRHRTMMLEQSALSMRDPIPLEGEEEDLDKAWEFEMTFTPFEDQTFLLINKTNWAKDVVGYRRMHWMGEIRSADGAALLGIYRLAHVRGEFSASSFFLFFNGDKIGLRDLGRKKEKVVYQGNMHAYDKQVIAYYESLGDTPFEAQ